MSKGYMWLAVIGVFIGGMLLGTYFYVNIMAEQDDNISALDESIQTKIVKQVQSENNIDSIEVLKNEIKVSPYAKMTIEKHFEKCNHTIVDIIDVPKELINLTEKELKKIYGKWEIKNFDSDNIHVYREIDANCSSHFVLKDKDGYLAIYNQITDSILELKEITDIELSSLREEDKSKIINGIKIYGKQELSSMLEDFNS